MKPYLSGEGSPNRGGLSLPKNKRILGAALLLVLGLIFVFFAVSPWEILPFLKGGSFRVQAGIIGGFLLLGGITNLLHTKRKTPRTGSSGTGRRAFTQVIYFSDAKGS